MAGSTDCRIQPDGFPELALVGMQAAELLMDERLVGQRTDLTGQLQGSVEIRANRCRSQTLSDPALCPDVQCEALVHSGASAPRNGYRLVGGPRSLGAIPGGQLRQAQVRKKRGLGEEPASVLSGLGQPALAITNPDQGPPRDQIGHSKALQTNDKSTDVTGLLADADGFGRGRPGAIALPTQPGDVRPEA
jgi:hypothetical protein